MSQARRENREPRAPREPRKPRENRESQTPREPRAPRQPRKPREPRAPREPRPQEPRVTLDKLQDKEYYQIDEAGWGKLMGDIELASAKTSDSASATASERSSGKYFARIKSPKGAICQYLKSGIQAGKKCEAKLDVSTDSETGYFTASITFLNKANFPLGLPNSTYAKLSDLQGGKNITLTAGPAPEGATQAQLTLAAVEISPEKVVDIKRVQFK